MKLQMQIEQLSKIDTYHNMEKNLLKLYYNAFLFQLCFSR